MENSYFENCALFEQQKTNSKLPVWLYIFGGRRIFGHAAPFKYGPEYLMDYQIILVTFAYRLGLAGN